MRTKPNSCESYTVKVNPKPSNTRKSDPVRLGEILPDVLRVIEERMKNRGEDDA